MPEPETTPGSRGAPTTTPAPALDPAISARITKANTPGQQQFTVTRNEEDEPGEPNLGSGGAGAAPSPGTGALGLPQPKKPPTVGQKIASFVTAGQGTPGSVWRGILSGALTGMVAGAGQHHFGAGVAAGGAAAERQRQQQLENQLKMSREEQEAQLRKMQMVDLQHRILGDVWDLTNKKQVATEQHLQWENTLRKEAMDAPGSIDLGIVRDANDLVALHAAHPNLPKDASQGNIFTVSHFSPAVDANGKPTGEQVYDGVQAFYIAPDHQKQMLDHDMTVPLFIPGKKVGEAGHFGEQTLEAGKYTNAAALQLLNERSAQAAKFDNDLAMAKATKASADAQYALARTFKTQSDANAAIADAQQQGEDLVEGAMDPTQLNRRAKDYDAKIAAARAYSIKKYGVPFDMAKAQSDYKDATKNRDTLDLFNSLIGFNPKETGNLGMLVRMSNGISRTDFPAINDAEAWAKLQKGDPAIGSYKLLSLEVADQVAKILTGGGTGSSSTDAKLKSAQDMFNVGFSKQSVIDMAKTLKEALENRKSGMMRNNRYLMRWYGPNSAIAQGIGAGAGGGGGADANDPAGIGPPRQ